MFTIFGATHTLTQEMMVLCAALGAFLLGIVLIAIDVVRRNRRRQEAENRPIDTSIFQPLPEVEEPEPAAAAEPETEEPCVPDFEILTPDTPASAVPVQLVYPVSSTIHDEEAEPEAPAAAEAPAQDLIWPVLVCDGFGAGFGSKTILADVSFTIPDHGITTLLGPTGTGKSTLLRALSGALAQSGLFKSWGHAWFCGAPLNADNRPLLVTQRIQLVQRPVLENLVFHLRDRTEDLPEEKQRKWASKWLSQAGADHIVPQLDRPFMELDPLAQRIVTILREAASEPALLLLDEPANGLAEADAALLLGVLERLASFTPLLVALQNHKHARRISNQIILLAGGQVQANCATEEFFDAPPNAAVAQFIATGACAVAGAETIARRSDEETPLTPPAALGRVAPVVEPAPEPVFETPAAEEHVAEPHGFDEPHAEAPVVEEPVFEEPVFEEHTTEEPVFEEPAFETHETEEPAAEEPRFIAPEDATPEEHARDAEPAPLSADELAAIKDEIRNVLAAELTADELAAFDAPIEPEAPEVPEAVESVTETAPEDAAPEHEPAETLHEETAHTDAEAEPVFVAEPTPEAPAFHEPEPIAHEPIPHEPEPVEPEPVLIIQDDTIHTDTASVFADAPHDAPVTDSFHTDAPHEETHEAEELAEPIAFPVNFAPGQTPQITIEMESVFSAAPYEAPAEPPHDDLPPISLSAHMIQSVPLPPRAAAAQMGANTPLRAEDEAVMRHPGQGNPGPRGFVWIEQGRLAATPMPGFAAPMEQDLDMLKQAGITALITLTEQDFPQHILASYGLRNVHFPIVDQKAPSTGETDILVGQMRDMLNQGEVLAVHCLAGLGRTGTILAAYMVKEHGLSAQAALNQIRRFNRQFVQTDDQEDFLMEYEVQQEQTVLRNRATGGSGPKLLQ